MKLHSKSGSLEEIIVEKILDGAYLPGRKIPPERTLRDRHQVSRTTVRTALARLEKEKLLVRKTGDGTYVSRDALKILRPADAPERLIAFIFPPGRFNNPNFLGLISAFQKNLPTRLGLKIYCHTFLKPEIYQRDQINLAIIDGQYDPHQRQNLHHYPFTVLIYNRESETENFLCPDNFAGGRLAIEYLARHHHQNIMYVNFLDFDHDLQNEFKQRTLGMEKAGAELGLNLQPINFANYRDSFNLHQLFDYMNMQKSGLSAAAATHDRVAVNFLEALEDKNLHVPDNVSLIGLDDHHLSRFLSVPLTSIKFPLAGIAQQLTEQLLAGLNQGPLKLQIKIPPVVIERQSVKNR